MFRQQSKRITLAAWPSRTAATTTAHAPVPQARVAPIHEGVYVYTCQSNNENGYQWTDNLSHKNNANLHHAPKHAFSGVSERKFEQILWKS